MSEARRLLRRPDAENVARTDVPRDYTGNSAEERSLYINMGIVKYGTTDRLQGAALFLALVLLALVILCIIAGFFGNADWAKEVIMWLGTPLSLVVGVAVGRGSDTFRRDGESS